jgi:hypothetical protein
LGTDDPDATVESRTLDDLALPEPH